MSAETTQGAGEARNRSLTRALSNSFPLRVWARFNRRNGLLLASGTSDQAVFAVFSALYIAVAVLGIWLGSSVQAVDSLLGLVNGLAPGLISFDGGPGLVSDVQVRDLAAGARPVWSVTGVVAFVVFAWTAVGWVTFLRSAVRDMFGLPAVDAHFAMVKVWDALAALGYAILLLTGGAMSAIGTSALGGVFDALGWGESLPAVALLGRSATVVVTLLVDLVVLVTLFTWLSGTDLGLRQVLPASASGAAALVILQFSAGWLLGRPPANPLIATFAILLGLFLWFRIAMIVVLLAAAWITERADETDTPIVERSEHERRIDEADLMVRAAEVRLREARLARRDAAWAARGRAIRTVTRAREELDEARERLATLEAQRAHRGRR
ncbi:YihY/virulence factor BrkB family protein [Microbacterium sp. GXS0129]|uniref:YihY/virulence factor BrkB family protein n=1 Tax=Microbacterium sp. GXS0129 TaxID=3377836 RepID=UPI00383A0C39